MSWFARRSAFTQSLLIVVIVLAIAGLIDAASAAPFGASASGAPSPVDGFTGWILMKQAEFYRMLSGAIRAAKADGTAAFGLMGISFAYGVFHAAGPGHGKAVISSYLVANEETARRGIVLSFASALMQALVAVLIVGIGACCVCVGLMLTMPLYCLSISVLYRDAYLTKSASPFIKPNVPDPDF